MKYIFIPITKILTIIILVPIGFSTILIRSLWDFRLKDNVKDFLETFDSPINTDTDINGHYQNITIWDYIIDKRTYKNL